MMRLLVLVLLAAGLVHPRMAAAQDNPFGSCSDTDVMRFQGSKFEFIPERSGARRYTATGTPVVITCNGMIFQANEIIFDDDTRAIQATGDVVLQQADLTLYADRANIDGKTRLGTFFNATGLAQLGSAPEQRSLFGTMEPNVLFWGTEVSKTGPATYQLKNGGFTTCVQATPRWVIQTSSGTLTLDKRAVLKNILLKVKDVPLMYLPVIYYPINKEDRSTGFLLPSYGSSSLKGQSLSNAFFMALGRSHDATLYHDWYSKKGQQFSGEYRYALSPDARGNGRVSLLNEPGGIISGIEQPGHRSYNIRADANQGFARGFRALGNVTYFTDIISQQLYQNIEDTSNRSRSFSGSLTGNVGAFRLNASMNRTDWFTGLTAAGRSGTLPSIKISYGDKPIGRSRVYVGTSGEATYFLQQDNIKDPTTDRGLFRLHAEPAIRAPLGSLPFLSGTASARLQLTRWMESLDLLTNKQVPVPLNRALLHLEAAITGPTFARVFQTPNNGYADRFKHLIEPGFGITRTTAFEEFNRVVRSDATDSLVGGVTTINYRLTNRFLARRRVPGMPGQPVRAGVAREILTVDLNQSFYSDALAAKFDPNYQSSAASRFSALRLRGDVRPADGSTASFNMEINPKARAIQRVSASGSLDSRVARVTASWSKQFVIPALPEFSEAAANQSLNATTTLRTPTNRAGGTYSFNVDLHNRKWLQQRIVVYFNSQCCGVSFDWQTRSNSLLLQPSERQFSVSFTLAGIGSFSNPFGSFGAGR